LLFILRCGCLTIMTLTLDQAQENLVEAVQHALQGESVMITLDAATLRLRADVPLRPPGHLTEAR
jgi:hypothetical protein